MVQEIAKSGLKQTEGQTQIDEFEQVKLPLENLIFNELRYSEYREFLTKPELLPASNLELRYLLISKQDTETANTVKSLNVIRSVMFVGVMTIGFFVEAQIIYSIIAIQLLMYLYSVSIQNKKEYALAGFSMAGEPVNVKEMEASVIFYNNNFSTLRDKYGFDFPYFLATSGYSSEALQYAKDNDIQCYRFINDGFVSAT